MLLMPRFQSLWWLKPCQKRVPSPPLTCKASPEEEIDLVPSHKCYVSGRKGTENISVQFLTCLLGRNVVKLL